MSGIRKVSYYWFEIVSLDVRYLDSDEIFILIYFFEYDVVMFINLLMLIIK